MTPRKSAGDPGAGDFLAGRPNILFVLCDQWRGSAFEFGPNHDSDVRTPGLKAFAESGVRFDRAYAANPVCTPNRSAILTGRFSHQTGMTTNDLMLPPDVPCLADIFQDAGYKTYYSGKWHMDGGEKPGYIPKNWRRRGFQVWEGMNSGHSYYAGTYLLDDDGNNLGTASATNGPDIELANFEPHKQVDLVNQFISDNKDEKWLAFVSFGPPHTPLIPPVETDTYDKNQLLLNPNVGPAFNDPEDTTDQPAEIAKYYGLCEALDIEFQRLMNHLESEGLSDDTLVVFTADHGDMLGSHGFSRKNQPHDSALRVPLFMRYPGRIQEETVVSAMVSSVDLMATLLGFAGLEVPDSNMGRSLAPLATGSGSWEDPPVWAESDNKNHIRFLASETEAVPKRQGWRAVMKRIGGTDYKYAVRSDGAGGIEPIMLTDLTADPYELENRVGDSELTAVQAELAEELTSWMSGTGDIFPVLLKDEGLQAPDSFPDTVEAQLPIKSRIVKRDGCWFVQCKSQSRIAFTLQEKSELTSGSWKDTGTVRHGNGNLLHFPIPRPMGSNRYFRIKAEQQISGDRTEFIEGGDLAGHSAADWSDGVPTTAFEGFVGLDIVTGRMAGILSDRRIVQLAGTMTIADGSTNSRFFGGTVLYTLAGGLFRCTNGSAMRLGNIDGSSAHVIFRLAGGTLDLSAAVGGSGLVFGGTVSVVEVEAGLLDCTGKSIRVQANSAHTDSPVVRFPADGSGRAVCANLMFESEAGGYVNFESSSARELTVDGDIKLDGTAYPENTKFEAAYNAGRIRYNHGDEEPFNDIFMIEGQTLRLKQEIDA